MRQRNTTAYPLIFPTLRPPVEVPEGGELDHDELLPGFEEIPAEPPEAPATTPVPAAPSPAAPSSAPSTPAATAPATQEA